MAAARWKVKQKKTPALRCPTTRTTVSISGSKKRSRNNDDLVDLSTTYIMTRRSPVPGIHRVKWRHISVFAMRSPFCIGQHVVLFVVVKWWRFVALFESNWISWSKKMSVLSLFLLRKWRLYWRQNSKEFAELAPQNGGKQLIWRNYVTVTYVYVNT